MGKKNSKVGICDLNFLKNIYPFSGHLYFFLQYIYKDYVQRPTNFQETIQIELYKSKVMLSDLRYFYFFLKQKEKPIKWDKNIKLNFNYIL